MFEQLQREKQLLVVEMLILVCIVTGAVK